MRPDPSLSCPPPPLGFFTGPFVALLADVLRTDTCDVVKHKDQIENLTEWKTRPDHFYYNKFFDPYIKRELEVIPVSLINNRSFRRPLPSPQISRSLI